MELNQIIDRFSKKSLNKGYKTLLHNGYSLNDIFSQLENIISSKLDNNKTSEVLSFFYLTGETFGYKIKDLCTVLFNSKDYPSFLKQAYRFETTELKEEIELAIRWHEIKKTPDSFAWKVKFAKLYEQNELRTNSTVKKVIDEDESIVKDEFVFKELKSIKTTSNAKIEHNPNEKIEFTVQKEKYISAIELHQKCQLKLETLLRDFGNNPIETNHIDIYVEIGTTKSIIEVKSVNTANERKQIRSAISQLYEYKYIYGLSDAELYIMLSQKPINEWLISYLENDRKINLIYLNKFNEMAGNGYLKIKKRLIANRKPVTNNR